jgi:hypothetical protein
MDFAAQEIHLRRSIDPAHLNVKNGDLTETCALRLATSRCAARLESTAALTIKTRIMFLHPLGSTATNRLAPLMRCQDTFDRLHFGPEL